MPTECSRDLFGYEVVEGRQVVAAFDGGQVTSDAGALLLGAANRAIGLVRRLARCFMDGRAPELVEHTVETMLMQRICGIALGYEDLIDHDQLRHDPVLAALAGKLEARRKDCAPLAGKSTLNRLEHAPLAPNCYHKIGHDGAAIEGLFVDLFLEAHKTPPGEIILDLDATDDPLHGHQEGRFFHGYYDCYCYLPLYVFCGRHLLAAKLRRSDIDASAGAVEEVARIVGQIRESWPRVEILLRADSGFARDELMVWCEANAVDYVFGLARNERLVGAIAEDLTAAEAESLAKNRPARRPVCRSYVGRDDARQPAQAVVRVLRLRAARGAPPHRPAPHPVRDCHLRHHPAQAVENRRPGTPQRAPDQGRHGLGLPLPGRVPPRLSLSAPRRLLSAPAYPTPRPHWAPAVARPEIRRWRRPRSPCVSRRPAAPTPLETHIPLPGFEKSGLL
jgi:Transposase DDE domain group 1